MIQILIYIINAFIDVAGYTTVVCNKIFYQTVVKNIIYQFILDQTI